MKKNTPSSGQNPKTDLAKRDAESHDIRPEMIERGRKLLANPDWPDMKQARDLARTILPSLY
jgi:hypothetical protein